MVNNCKQHEDLTGSLEPDAGHNFGDVLGLLLAWGAHSMAQWQPTKCHSYGFRSASILAALLTLSC